MTAPRFTLLVVATADGFIARAPGHAPADWASPEEQALFLAAVDRADWSVMGRGTHEAAPKPWRRRIVFSTSAPQPEWRAERQLWLDPEGLTGGDLAALVAPVHPLREGLILGGGAVHGWFHARGLIEAVELTVEPTRFGSGLPIFPDQRAGDAFGAFAEKGYAPVATRGLNAGGTVLARLRRAGARPATPATA